MTDKKGMKYVPVYLEWLDVTQDLTAEEKGNLIDAVVAYASGIEYESMLTTAGIKIAFRFMKGQVDRNAELSEKRSKAASKDEQPEAKESEPEQTGTNRNKPEQNETNSPKKENKKEKEKEETNIKRFVPPTLDEVTAYMAEIGCNVDPQYFIDYHVARNWVLSNGKQAKDWKAICRTWKHNNFTRDKPKVVNAQQYQQRDYSDEQAEAMRRMIEGAGA